jgi:hypothetical protein
MGELRTLHRDEGDLKIEWDPARPAEVVAARAQFDALRAQSYVAYHLLSSGGQGRVLQTFDPAAERIILSPALRGGPRLGPC